MQTRTRSVRGIRWWLKNWRVPAAFVVRWAPVGLITHLVIHSFATTMGSLYFTRIGATWFEVVWTYLQLPGVVQFVLATALCLAWTQLRRRVLDALYGAGPDWDKLTLLLALDPEMALVRQRIMLETAVCALTPPADKESDGNTLADRLRGLSALQRIPRHVSTSARKVRQLGNDAAHPPRPSTRRRRSRLEQFQAAVDEATKGAEELRVFLRWYRREGRRHPMTEREWQQYKSWVSNRREAA